MQHDCSRVSQRDHASSSCCDSAPYRRCQKTCQSLHDPKALGWIHASSTRGPDRLCARDPARRRRASRRKFQTTPAGGPYAPRNVVAVWVEDSGGNFVKTIGRWAMQRKQYLLQWTAKAGANDADAVTSATRGDHLNFIQAIWNLQNKQNVVVPDGTYTIRMELADSDGGNTNEGTFTFVKSANPQVQTNLSNGGFINATISYAAAAACGNNVVDPGETCDGGCPTSCAASADACAPNVLVGTAPSVHRAVPVTARHRVSTTAMAAARRAAPRRTTTTAARWWR